MSPPSAALSLLLQGCLGLLVLAMALCFVRIVRGPSAPDRVVALDLLGVVALGVTVVYSVLTGERHLLRVAVSLALIAFLGTVAMARYLERRVRG